MYFISKYFMQLDSTLAVGIDPEIQLQLKTPNNLTINHNGCQLLKGMMKLTTVELDFLLTIHLSMWASIPC